MALLQEAPGLTGLVMQLDSCTQVAGQAFPVAGCNMCKVCSKKTFPW